jgi:hypothetical protein
MKVEKLGTTLGLVHARFGIDSIDLVLLATGIDERVTDVLLDCKHLGSPANLHSRLTKKLVKKKLVKLTPCENDARVKYVTEGTRLKELEEIL